LSEAYVSLCLGKYSRPLYESLLAEVSQPSPRKASVNISLVDSCLSLTIKARDINSLRAVLNSYLYLIYAMYSVLSSENSYF